MSTRAAAACAALLALQGARAAPEEFTVDRAHTFPAFEVLHLGISTQRGRFDRTSGRITLDRAAGQGTIDVEIDTAAVSTGNGSLDAALRGEDFFHVEKHPRMVFRSKQLQFEEGVPRRVTGELTLLEATLPVTLEIERFACTRLPLLVRTTCGADLSATLSRAAFGMGSYAKFIGDEVRIRIQVEAFKVEPAAQPPAPGG